MWTNEIGAEAPMPVDISILILCAVAPRAFRQLSLPDEGKEMFKQNYAVLKPFISLTGTSTNSPVLPPMLSIMECVFVGSNICASHAVRRDTLY